MPLDSSQAVITQQAERLRTDFALSPITASEIEFYLIGSEGHGALSAFWEAVKASCAQRGISIFKIEKEKGQEQHEIALMPGSDPIKTALDTQNLKTLVSDLAFAHGMRADFSARPFTDQPGSGLHIHVHLADTQGKNVFYKRDEVMSDALKFSMGGLLARMKQDMPAFAPRAESYARFVAGSNAPLTVSWGANNRTVAIRLPDSEHDNKRIEHRVAGADADPMHVLAVMLSAIHHGLKNRIEPGPQIYGDASMPQYGLKTLLPS